MRALVIGLDGVPRRLLERLAERGVVPHLAGLIRRGVLHDLRAGVPEVSAVSWTDFMTGADAGRHGIFGFTELGPGGRLRFPRFGDVAVPTVWDRLGERGRRSVVLNQPATYPARSIPGALVSGFVAPDLGRAVYPALHLAALERLGYVVDVETGRAQADPAGFVASLRLALAARERAVGHFWTAERWDLFQVVVTGTDRLQHFLWDALEEEDHPLHGEVLSFYRAVDAFAGRLVARFEAEEPGGLWLVLSDHGFTRARVELRLNAWLARAGFLSCRGEDRSSPACLDPSSRAVALDPGRIHLLGGEDPGLAEELAAALGELSWEGRPVCRRIWRREEAYHGPLAVRGPALVAEGADGFDLKGTLRAQEPFGPPRLPGMHDPFGFLLAPCPCGEALAMAGVAPLLEEALR